MKHIPVRLGLAPIGKFVFSHDDAVRQKRAVQERLGALGVDFVDLDELFPDTEGLIEDVRQVPAAVAHLRAQGVDAVFLPHCNFGTESAAGLIARDLGVPTLLWGPRDDAPNADGSRLRDSLCGLFASSRVIRMLVGDKYTYLENCRVTDEDFDQGVLTFLRAARVVKAVRTMRVGLVGGRVPFFWTTIVNEAELLKRFSIEVLPYEVPLFLDEVHRRVREERADLDRELDEWEGTWFDPVGTDRGQLLNGVAATRELRAMAERDGLDALAIQTFDALWADLGSGAGLYNEALSEDIPVAIESDIHGAISQVMLRAARLDERPVFMPEFVVRHPEDDNVVCLWHVGAPHSLRHPDGGKVHLREPWILPGDRPIQGQMRLADGPLTLARFDGDGDYRLGIGRGELVEGPYTRDYYGWLRVDNWPVWERQLMQGPYIHHLGASYAVDVDALVEAARYLDIPVEFFGEG